MAKKNKYREARPEWFDEKGRPHVWVLKALIDYDPETGSMTWKERGPEWFLGDRAKRESKRWSGAWSGKNVGKVKIDRTGKKVITLELFGIPYSALRVAYAIENGEWPNSKLGTADGDGSNLKIQNIFYAREVLPERVKELAFFSNRENMSSKYFGVRRKHGKYVAVIGLNGCEKHLGCFKTEEQAADAYDTAARKYFGPSTYTNDAIHPDREPQYGPITEPNVIREVDPSEAAITDGDDF